MHPPECVINPWAPLMNRNMGMSTFGTMLVKLSYPYISKEEL